MRSDKPLERSILQILGDSLFPLWKDEVDPCPEQVGRGVLSPRIRVWRLGGDRGVEQRLQGNAGLVVAEVCATVLLAFLQPGLQNRPDMRRGDQVTHVVCRHISYVGAPVFKLLRKTLLDVRHHSLVVAHFGFIPGDEVLLLQLQDMFQLMLPILSRLQRVLQIRDEGADECNPVAVGFSHRPIRDLVRSFVFEKHGFGEAGTPHELHVVLVTVLFECSVARLHQRCTATVTSVSRPLIARPIWFRAPR